MGFTYGLAVVLVIIFEGIIIQCEGTGNITSSNRIQGAPTVDTEVDQPFLPNDLIEVIVGKTDFATIKNAVKWRIIRATGIVMSRILQDRVILIMPDFDGSIYENDVYLRFSSYQRQLSFFDKFGDRVKKIEILYKNDVPHNEIYQNMIKRCAKNLEELRFITELDEDDVGFWEDILEGENCIIFPKLKKLQLLGRSTRDELKLNLLFPKLECIEIIGYVADVDCLKNVRGLKELLLCTNIPEDRLEGIFENNDHMTKISLSVPEMVTTMRAIAKYLTNLNTLKLQFPSEDFLLRANDDAVYKLSSVSHFDILFDEMDEQVLIGNLSFVMPNLKKLILDVNRTDDRIIKFIEQFKKIEILELLVNEYNAVECIGKLHQIKEFTTTFHENGFDYLKNLFENFDEKSKLQTLKFVYFDGSSYETYEAEMKKINIHLEKTSKPTWALSQGEQTITWGPYRMEIRQNCLMFRRET